MTTPRDTPASRRVRANGDGTVYQRKDSRWEAAGYVLAPGNTRKRIRVYGPTRKEALAKLTEKIAASNRGVPTPSTRSARTPTPATPPSPGSTSSPASDERSSPSSPPRMSAPGSTSSAPPVRGAPAASTPPATNPSAALPESAAPSGSRL